MQDTPLWQGLGKQRERGSWKPVTETLRIRASSHFKLKLRGGQRAPPTHRRPDTPGWCSWSETSPSPADHDNTPISFSGYATSLPLPHCVCVYLNLYISLLVNWELSIKEKSSVYWLSYVPTLTCGYELWVVTSRISCLHFLPNEEVEIAGSALVFLRK